jgi:two-component system sensor kinase FixL
MHEPAELSSIVTVDAVQIEQVLINLIRNAIGAMAGQDASQRRLVLPAKRDDHRRGCVGVCDSGCGLDDSLKNHLFEAFDTTKLNGLGLNGLGLGISRSVVESHVGSLSARPSPGGGVTFSFTLPLHGEVVHEPRLDCVRG